MALYHFAARIIQRSKGQSAIASAAYRAGERLDDERLGRTFDYRRHLGVLHTEILVPDNAPDWMRDRSRLWNAVEKAEKRKDSQLARSIDIALPHELNLEQNLELLRGFVQEQYVDAGMIADIAIHLPGRTGDIRNVHAHLALTTREITGSGFGLKERDWNSTDELLEWRKAWADHANRILEREGFEERIDHRSLEDQGYDREPTIHVGPPGKQMDERGDRSDRAHQNRDIKADNDNMALLKNELTESETRLVQLRRQLASERMEHIQKTIRAADAVWEKAEQRPAETRPLDLQEGKYYPDKPKPPVSAGGKAASMPDDLTKQQELAAQHEADRQKQAQEDEQAHQKKAIEDENNRVQQLRDADNKRAEENAKQNADRLAAQAEAIRQQQKTLDAQKAEQARLDAIYRAELEKTAFEGRRREEAERQTSLEAQAKKGPIHDAGLRYGQALGQHYDMRDPYASLAKAAMAEYAAFLRDREAYDQKIAKTADPIERQALDLRKRIEGAEYLAMTGDRIATQSEIITGRLNSQEAIKERNKATDYRIQAQDLRQQLRDLHQERAPAKDQSRERAEPQAEPTRPEPSRNRGPNRYDDLIKKVDDAAKAKEPEPDKDAERQRQQERERELQRKRDRER